MSKPKYLFGSSSVTHNGRTIDLSKQSQEGLANLFAAGCPGIEKEEEGKKGAKQNESNQNQNQ